MNISDLARDIGLDESEYREVLDLFAPTAQRDLDTIKTAVADGDPARVARASHSLKGASANLGLTNISNEAREIEEKSSEGRLHETAAAVKALGERLAELERLLAGEMMLPDDRGAVDDRR